MPFENKQPEEKWLEKAICQLNQLCCEAVKFADDCDETPSKIAYIASVELLKTFKDTQRPKMGLTVNGEILLAWENTGDEFRAYIKSDGSVQFFRNKDSVDKPSFCKYLTAVPA